MPRLRGARSALQAAIGAFGAPRIAAFYHPDAGLTASAGALVSWADMLGRGPTLLPNGGLGGTAPTVSGGTVNTDGAASFLANAAASAAFALDGTGQTVMIWGEMLGSTAQWGGLVDAIVSPAQQCTWGITSGAASVSMNGTLLPVATAQRAAGTRSLWIMSRNAYDFVSSAQSSGKCTVSAEWVGRGRARSAAATNNTGVNTQGGTGSGGRQLPAATVDICPTFTSGNGFLCLGRVGATFGAVKIRGILVLSAADTYADRVAIETFVQRAAENVTLYTGASDSTGLALCFGESTVAGAFADTYLTAFATPPATNATTYPAHLQRMLTAASHAVDVAPWGQGGQDLFDLLNVNTSQARNGLTRYMPGVTWSFVHDCLAALSPARRAAGLKELVILGNWSNDIGHYTLTGAQLYAMVVTVVALVHAAGGKVAVATMLPRDNFGPTTVNGARPNEVSRLAYNTLVRANSAGADLLIDHATTVDVANGSVLPFQDPDYVNFTISAQNGGGGPAWTYTDARGVTGKRYFWDGTHLADDGTTSFCGYSLVAGRVYAAATAAGLL